MNVYNGKPTDLEGRLEKEIKTYDLLDSLNIAYTRVDHEEACTMEICLEIGKALDVMICKNLFLCNRQETDFYMLIMPDDKIFKTKDLSAQIGSSRLSFGTPENMEKYLNLTPGSVSVLGLANDINKNIRLLIDEELLSKEYLGFHPCINTSSIKIKTSDLLEKFLPHVEHEYTTVSLIRYE